MEYNENIFKSTFKKDITNYLNEKGLLKQGTKTLFYTLRQFDDYCYNQNIENNILTKDLVLKWLEKRPNEEFNNQSKRASMIRCFGTFLYRYNKENYIVPKMLFPIREKYIPHIYTNDEIKRFFNIVDNLSPKVINDNKPIIMPIIYRILLFTGMRINEVLSLKIKDFKIEGKSILVRNAKNHKDRLLPISDDLFNKLMDYNNSYNNGLNEESYLFRNNHNNRITNDRFYKYFRLYLLKAKIPHAGKGPRVHDFRHTMTVNCIHNWLQNNKDVKALLPYLQNYLGHDNIESTYYYYHLTLSIYPYLENKIIEVSNDIIPSINEDDINE